MRVAIVTQALLISTCPRFMIVLVQHDNMANRHRLPVVDVRNYLSQKQYPANCSTSSKRVIRRAASKNYQVNTIFLIDGEKDVYMGTYIDNFM